MSDETPASRQLVRLSKAMLDDCERECERLRVALRAILENEYSEFGGIGQIARDALSGKSVENEKK